MIQCTQRESEVLLLLMQGLGNKAIATQLGISPNTVRDHVCSLCLRHDLTNRVELAIVARTQPWQIGADPRHVRVTKLNRPMAQSDLPSGIEGFRLTASAPLHL